MIPRKEEDINHKCTKIWGDCQERQYRMYVDRPDLKSFEWGIESKPEINVSKFNRIAAWEKKKPVIGS